MTERMTPEELDAIRKRHRAVGNKLDFRSEPIAQIHADRAALLRHVDALEQEVGRLREETSILRAELEEERGDGV